MLLCHFPVLDGKFRTAVQAAKAQGAALFLPDRHLHRKGGIQLHPSCRQHPLVDGDRQTPLAINDKKVALSGAGGAAGTAKCREKLTELLTLPFIRADVMTEPQTGIQLNKEAWTEGRMILTETQRESLRSQVDAFLEYIG